MSDLNMHGSWNAKSELNSSGHNSEMPIPNHQTPNFYNSHSQYYTHGVYTDQSILNNNSATHSVYPSSPSQEIQPYLTYKQPISDYPNQSFIHPNNINSPQSFPVNLPPEHNSFSSYSGYYSPEASLSQSIHDSKPLKFTLNQKLKQGLTNKPFPIFTQTRSILNQKICSFCLSPEDSLITSCMHPICSVCICNFFEEYLTTCNSNIKTLKKFSCQKPNCQKPYNCSSFKDFVLEESYMNYLELESVIMKEDLTFPGLEIQEPEPTQCLFCEENHKSREISCYMFYKQQFLCRFCKNREYEVKIKCGHFICRPCAIIQVVKMLEENPLDFKLKCADEKCKELYDISFVYNMVGGVKKFEQLRDEQISLFLSEPKVCSVCYGEFKVNKINTIPCGHNICNDCLKAYLVSCLNINDIKKINKCPECNSENADKLEDFIVIHQSQIMKLLDEKQLNLYEKLTLRGISTDAQDKKLVLKWCKDCDFAAFIEAGFDHFKKVEFKCPNCKTTYCAKCHTNHFGLICGSSRYNSNKNNTEAFAEGVKYNACPNCKEAVFKCNGCNFLKCIWPSCKGVNFCAICQKQLTVLIT